MSCNNTCRLCRNFIISEEITFDGTNLIINLPAGSYGNGCRYCIVVAQTIPAETTIVAPVFISIGDGTELYPLTNQCCAQLTACAIRTRTKYSTVVATDATGGTFKLLGRAACAPNYSLAAIDGTAPDAGGGAGA